MVHLGAILPNSFCQPGSKTDRAMSKLATKLDNAKFSVLSKTDALQSRVKSAHPERMRATVSSETKLVRLDSTEQRPKARLSSMNRQSSTSHSSVDGASKNSSAVKSTQLFRSISARLNGAFQLRAKPNSTKSTDLAAIKAAANQPKAKLIKPTSSLSNMEINPASTNIGSDLNSRLASLGLKSLSTEQSSAPTSGAPTRATSTDPLHTIPE